MKEKENKDHCVITAGVKNEYSDSGPTNILEHSFIFTFLQLLSFGLQTTYLFSLQSHFRRKSSILTQTSVVNILAFFKGISFQLCTISGE